MPDHYVILHRWVDEYAQYENYIDHHNSFVTYITTFHASRGVPPTASAVQIVEATDDVDEVLRAAAILAQEFGAPTHVVALYEDDTICGARLREEYSCPGPKVDDLIRFRDKRIQADAMAHAGVRAPKYCSVESSDDALRFADEIGYPIVVKPTRASSCKGIQIVAKPQDVRDLQLEDAYKYIAQEFIEFPVYHIDGLYSRGQLVRVGVNRYFNTCIGFQKGGYLGSLEVDDSPLRRAAVRFAEDVLRAICLSDETIVFHLELFVDHNAMPDEACTFLELAARVGGGGIPFVWREIYNFDIMRMQFELSCGRSVESVPTAQPSASAGWLLMQLPHERPCKIESVTSLVGTEMGPYAESVPYRGQVVPLTDTFFEHVAGRFRFRGENHTELFEKMIATANAFRVEASPLVDSFAGSSAR